MTISQIDLLIQYIMPFLQIRLNSMRYIRIAYFFLAIHFP